MRCITYLIHVNAIIKIWFNFNFLDTEDAVMLDQVLQTRPAVLEHLSNEITTVLMHTIVENFRTFATMVPIKHYYQYYVHD